MRAAVEDLPPELAGVADRVTVVLPWGSLLAAVAHPSVTLLVAEFVVHRREEFLGIVREKLLNA